MHKKLVIIAFAFFMYFIVGQAHVLAVAVRPMKIELETRPGNTETFEFVLVPEDAQETVSFTLYQPSQGISGGLSFIEGDASGYQPLDWVSLETDQVIVPPGEEVTIRGQVRVPYNASGSHTVIIMAEPGVQSNLPGVQVQTRYAIRVEIDVDAPRVRPRITLNDFSLIANQQGHPVLIADVTNSSIIRYPVSAEVTIRDTNLRLIERAALATEVAWRNGLASTEIYPGANVHLFGQVTEPLFPGDYSVRLFLRYADGRQVIKTEQVTVAEGDFTYNGRMNMVGVKPDEVSVELRPGAAGTQLLELQNRTDQDLLVQVAARDIVRDYPYSVFESVQFDTRGELQQELASRKSSRLVLIMRTARDLAEQGYYGLLEVHVFNSEQEYIETTSIPISAIVGENWTYQARVLGLDYHHHSEEHLFSAGVENLGSVHISPSLTLYLKDTEGEILRTLRPRLQEDVSTILPLQTENMVVTVTDLEPGDYLAELILMHQGQEIDRNEYPLTIEQ